jgi:hypothetical protein
MRKVVWLVALWPVLASAADLQGDAALLQALDKITARVSTIVAPINQTVTFGGLRVTARSCRKRPPEETPEATAFLEIDVLRPGQTQAERRFTGWMFASSPAVSAMEDSVYDVWVVDCRVS